MRTVLWCFQREGVWKDAKEHDKRESQDVSFFFLIFIISAKALANM